MKRCTLPIHRTVLNNGITLLVSENPTADIVAARIFVRCGSCYETSNQAGLSNLLAAVMTKGCDGLSSWEIAEEIESVGASFGTDATTDYFLLSLKTVSSDFNQILTLAARVLRSPTFPTTQIELERRLAIQDIRSQQEKPFTLAFNQIRELIYEQHPYGRSVLGREETISSLSRQDLVEYHQTYFRPDNIVISIAGRVTSEDTLTLVEKIFGDWCNPPQSPPLLRVQEIFFKPQHQLKPIQTQQSIIMLGYLGSSVSSADYAPLKLLSTYLGNGLSSRLFVELREKRGLAYEVSAFYPTRLYPGAFVVYMGTAAENTTIALEALRTEVDLLCSTELSANCLQTAKNKILGQYALGKQTNGQIAQIYGWYETLGLGLDFDENFQELIASVTINDTVAVAHKYLQLHCVSLVGQEQAINSAFPIY